MFNEKQIRVLHLAGRGLVASEIGAELGVSRREVYRSLRTAREQSGARTNHELVARAVAEGLVDPGAEHRLGRLDGTAGGTAGEAGGDAAGIAGGGLGERPAEGA